MFSSKAKLEKVGFGRQGRFEYLQALVTEFQDTHKQGGMHRTVYPMVFKLCHVPGNQSTNYRFLPTLPTSPTILLTTNFWGS